MNELLQLNMYNFDLPVDWNVKIKRHRSNNFNVVLDIAKMNNSNIIIKNPNKNYYFIINFVEKKSYDEILNLVEKYQNSLEKSNTENVNAPKLFLVKFHYDFILQGELNTLTFGKD